MEKSKAFQPRLDEVIPLTEAAGVIGISRQGLHQMLRYRNIHIYKKWPKLHLILIKDLQEIIEERKQWK